MQSFGSLFHNREFRKSGRKSPLNGIDPDTGKMTPAGRAFFEELVAEQNRLKPDFAVRMPWTLTGEAGQGIHYTERALGAARPEPVVSAIR